MTENNLKITEKLLYQLDACNQGMKFLKINNLSGFPLNKLHTIEGDYEYFISWISSISDITLDNNNNIIEYTHEDETVYLTYYHNGLIHTKLISSDGDMYGTLITTEYDNNNNIIKTIEEYVHINSTSKTPYHSKHMVYKYDNQNRVIESTNSLNLTSKYIYHDDNSEERIIGSYYHTQTYYNDRMDTIKTVNHITGYTTYIDYEYDQNGNIVSKIERSNDKKEVIINISTEFYPDGQLKCIKNEENNEEILEIPYFKKD